MNNNISNHVHIKAHQRLLQSSWQNRRIKITSPLICNLPIEIKEDNWNVNDHFRTRWQRRRIPMISNPGRKGIGKKKLKIRSHQRPKKNAETNRRERGWLQSNSYVAWFPFLASEWVERCHRLCSVILFANSANWNRWIRRRPSVLHPIAFQLSSPDSPVSTSHTFPTFLFPLRDDCQHFASQ